MKKAMISQPMKGRTKERILKERESAVRYLTERGYEVVDTVFDISDASLNEFGVKVNPVYFLSQAIQEMSKCDTVYFCKGWEKTRGCLIEHEIAKNYGMKIMYEGETEQEQKFRELREAAAPLVEYMNQNYCPHDMAIVRQGGVEIVSGQMTIPFPVKD